MKPPRQVTVHCTSRAPLPDRTEAAAPAILGTDQLTHPSLPDTPRNRAFAAQVRAAVLRRPNTGVRLEDGYIVTPTGGE